MLAGDGAGATLVNCVCASIKQLNDGCDFVHTKILNHWITLHFFVIYFFSHK